MEDIKKQVEDLLKDKVVNCKNSTTIFDTNDYILLSDAVDVASKVLSQYVSDTTFADAFRAISDHYRWRKVSEELPSNEYKNEVMPQTLCLTKSKRYGIKLLAYNHSYDVWDDEYLDDYVCDRDDIEEWKPID